MTHFNYLFFIGLIFLKPMPNAQTTQQFSAKFYDETGKFLGIYGQIDSLTPIYIVNSSKIPTSSTPLSIVELIGKEYNTNRVPWTWELRQTPIAFKLPPKSHRQAIKKAIEDAHLGRMDSVDYEMGGCGYHNSRGDFWHLQAENGNRVTRQQSPAISPFNALDFYQKVDTEHQLISDKGSKLIEEVRIEYTWHTHPPKVNGARHEQMPSVTDYKFALSYSAIKQHFLISLKYKTVFYYGTEMLLPSSGELGSYHFKMDYDVFFGLEN